MARQNINIGSSANDGTGDPLRTAFDKINDNFIELYGADNDINTLDANMDVNNFAITTGVTNGDVTITPNGTGNINLGSITINGSTVSANDSTQITLAENIQTTGTLNVSGAVTIGGATTISTSLALASGATVTSILDEDAMGSDSATALATQQSIKAYVDAQVTASDLDFQGDSGGALSVDLDSQTFTVAGGTGIDTAGSGQTLTVNIDSSVVTLTGSQTLTNKVLTSPTISSPTITGVTTTTSLTTNDITSNGSNANITINPQGTGTIELGAATNVTGSASVSGTLSTADITTTGNQTISGSLTTGSLNVGDLNINPDGKISTDTNGNIDLDPSGTGAINLTGPTNVTGTATVTGQLNVDNLRLDANTISSTSGGVNITAPAGQDVAIGGTGVRLTATEANFTLAEITTLRADTIQNDTSDGDISISTQGTGVIDLNTATQTTVGSAGGANALPATPTGYIKIKIAGTMRVIPFYDEA
jgi:LEA14-like dessication related protein